MFTGLKTKIYTLLLAKGIYLRSSPRPNKNDLLRLISKFKPFNTNHELIRIGSKNDGGYLIPNDLEEIKYCFSAGISDNCQFEEQLAKRGIQCFMADGSIDCPPNDHDNFIFDSIFIKANKTDGCTTLADWSQTYKKTGELCDAILSMDIEGDELESILSTPNDVLNKFRIITVEVHGLERVIHKPFIPLFSAFLDKLLASFTIVHLHPNNACPIIKVHDITIPGTIELTLINNSRLDRSLKFQHSPLPHLLDTPNHPGKPDIKLSEEWQDFGPDIFSPERI